MNFQHEPAQDNKDSGFLPLNHCNNIQNIMPRKSGTGFKFRLIINLVINLMNKHQDFVPRTVSQIRI